MRAAPTPSATPGQPAQAPPTEAAAVASPQMTLSGLPAPTRDRVRRSFGPEVDYVRLHTSAHAQAIAGDRPAAAYGQDVYFAAGQFRPDTLAGEALLAHTVQQRGCGPASGACAAAERRDERSAAHAQGAAP